jgi:hypothetical protein
MAMNTSLKLFQNNVRERIGKDKEKLVKKLTLKRRDSKKWQSKWKKTLIS